MSCRFAAHVHRNKSREGDQHPVAQSHKAIRDICFALKKQTGTREATLEGTPYQAP